MTERVNALVVVLEKDIRIDDVESLVTAIRHIRGVLTVTPHVADKIDENIGAIREKEKLREKLVALIRESL